jgi:hypothetical protein
LEIAYDILIQAGLARPQRSRHESLSPEELHEKLFKANDLDLDGLNAQSALVPGKIWQALAVDLFMGNMDQADWGWADARSVWLLDFWKELDAQIRFVLMYSAPEIAIGRMLRDRRTRSSDVATLVASWKAYHEEMLRFYNRNADRCLLVNMATVLHGAESFVEKVNTTFHLNLGEVLSQEQADRGSVSAIAATLAKTLIEDQEEAHALYRELESTADIADHQGIASGAENIRALAEYCELLASIDKANAKIRQHEEDTGKLRDEQGKLSDELQMQTRQLTQAQGEYAKLAKDYAELKGQLQDLTLQLKDAVSKDPENQAELVQENELLLLQLHQVQEELEQYYLKWKELASSQERESDGDLFINRFWNRHQPSEILIDFRDEVEGDNWYYTEFDGRWAGPGNVSTVTVPALRKGRYELYLDVIDAMEPEILTGTVLSLNGSELQVTAEGPGYPVMLYSEFTVEDISQHPLWEFQLKFPHVISPAQHGSDDERDLAIRVRSLKLRMTA